MDDQRAEWNPQNIAYYGVGVSNEGVNPWSRWGTDEPEAGQGEPTLTRCSADACATLRPAIQRCLA